MVIFEVLHHANKHFFDAAPWTLVKQKDTSVPLDPEKLKLLNNILYLTLESLRLSAVSLIVYYLPICLTQWLFLMIAYTLLQPIIPNTSAKILDLLGIPQPLRQLTGKGKEYGYDYVAANAPLPGKIILFAKKTT